MELLPTMTHSYDITGHVTGRGELKAGVIWKDIFYLQRFYASPWNFTQLTVILKMV